LSAFFYYFIVPPATPLLHSTGSSSSSIQLQWKLGDDGGSPVRGFVLHFKPDQGEWTETRVERHLSTFALSGLRCGTQYHVYLVAYNRLGSSPSSVVLKERTRGSRPPPPPVGTADNFLLLNVTKIGLRLESWPDGGCPIVYFTVEFLQVNSPSGEWQVGE
jgi:Down syndrome cell adhesion molecule